VVHFTPTTHHDTYPAIDTRGSPGWDCRGKAMLITGANGGVGRAVAQAYARAGASHVGLGVRRVDVGDLVGAVKAAAAEGHHPEPTVTILLINLDDRASVTAAAERLEREWGRLDIVISNAGHLPPFEPLLEGDEADWWRAWEINVRGTYWTARAFLPLLLGCGGDKTFVAVSSLGAHILTPGASAYQTTKFAVVRLAEFLMQDYGDQVRPNEISYLV
jgi:NAD(P)-dependent dehydrogenase (short-subunit alcohol dehydrogenase family)